ASDRRERVEGRILSMQVNQTRGLHADDPWRRAIGPVALLLLLVVGVYRGTLAYPLVFDDVYWFSPRNIRILGDIGIDQRFLSKKFVYFLVELTGGNVAALRIAVILLHAAVAVALFWFLARLFEAATGAGAGDRRAWLAATIAALVF